MTFSPESIPPSPETLKPLLESAGISSGSIRIHAIPAEASSRKYYRILTSSENQSVIFCQDLPFLCDAEHDFIALTKVLSESGIDAPKILASLPKEGMILISDGGDLDLAQYNQSMSDIRKMGIQGFDQTANPEMVAEFERHMYLRTALYFRSLSNLVRLHAAEPPEIVRKRSFDYEKLRWELDFLKERIRLNMGESLLNQIWTSSFEKMADTVCISLDSLLHNVSDSSYLLEMKPVFTHRDYHSRNILFRSAQLTEFAENSDFTDMVGFTMKPALERYRILSSASDLTVNMIDYQDARMGLPVYDLVSLIFDAYTLLGMDERDFIIKTYFSMAVAAGILTLKDYKGKADEKEIFQESGRLKSFQEFLDILIIQLTQRMLKVTGSFIFLSFEKGMEKYLESLTNTMLALKILSDLLQSGGIIRTRETEVNLTQFSETLESFRRGLNSALILKIQAALSRTEN